jgi:hypothetical protein
METRHKIVAAAVAVLAIGGVGAGTAFASTPTQAPVAVPSASHVASVVTQGGQQGPGADTPEPGDTADQPGTPDVPEAGDTPDAPGQPDTPDAGETAGAPDLDNVQQ